MARNPHLAGDFVHLDGKRYDLSRTVSFRDGRSTLGPPAYSSYSVRTQEGDPLNERPERYQDWSRGIGDGRDFIPGGVHYAVGVNLPQGRIALGPRVYGVILDNGLTDATVLDLEVSGSTGQWLWAGVGSRIFRIDLSNNGVIRSVQQNAVVLSLQLWRGAMFAALGSADPYVVNPVANTGAGTHGWAEDAGDDEANAFGISRTSGSGPSLVRGLENKWSRLAPDDATGIDGSWGAEYVIGGDAPIAQLRSHNYSDYILKADGLYSFGDVTEEATNLLGDLDIFPSAENRWMTTWHNTLLVCTAVGLFRVFGGVQRTTGVEECELNTIAYGRPTAAVGFGRLFYEARKLGSKTVIMQYRLSRGRETALDAPFTPISIVDVFEGDCKAMAITAHDGETRLWYGAEFGLRYIELTIDGTPAEVTNVAAFSNNTADTIADARPTVAFSPTYFGSTDTVKYLRKIELSMEGTGNVRIDVAGQELEADAADGHVELFLPADVEGYRRFSPVIKMHSGAPEVLSMTFYFAERPVVAFGCRFGLRLRNDAGVLVHGKLNEVRELLDGEPITFVDPDGVDRLGFLGLFEDEVPWTYGEQAPVHDVALQFREVLRA